jgi:hypothetical protein
MMFILIFTSTASGGFERTELSARARALGGSYVGLADDVWAIFFNAGGLTQLTRKEVSFLYVPEQFGLKELSCSAGAFAFPTGVGVIGFAGRRYGFDLYREFTGTISYANTLSNVGIGFNLNYHSLSIKNYGSAGTVGIDIGILAPVFDQVRLGVSAKNINAPTIGSSRERLPQIFSTGIAYSAIEDLSIMLDYQKELGFDPSPRAGFEYRMADVVAIRGGVSDEPTEYSGGIGIKLSIFQIDYAYSSHQDLGATHIGSISIRWGDDND